MNKLSRLGSNTVKQIIRFGLLGMAAGLVCSCAEMKPPPGGEVDRQGPFLIASEPGDGALNVGAGNQIILTFSERLVEPGKGKGIFISPRPTVPPQVEWKSETIRISLAEPFEPNQTYVVTVSTEVADLRRNRVDSAIMVAFSTGDILDSGMVAGQIMTEANTPAIGWPVGLYDNLAFPDELGSDSMFPAYLTTTNKDGRFSFKYLAEGQFRLLAFTDKNRDELFNPNVDEFALPDRKIRVGHRLGLDQLLMTATKYDSLTPNLLSAVSTSDGLVRLRLSRPIHPAFLAETPERLTLESHGSDPVVYESQGILEADKEETAIITSYFGPLAEGLYRLKLEYAADKPALVDDSVFYKAGTDKEAPTLVAFQPKARSVFVNQLVLSQTYSEPLDQSSITDQTYVLWEDEESIIGLVAEWTDCFKVRLRPERVLPGKKYRLDVAEFDLKDLAGQQLGDSVRSTKFSTLDNDSLGSISGQLMIRLLGRETAPALLIFKNAASSQSFDLEVAPLDKTAADDNRRFTIDLPAGKYLVSGFLDSDQDGTFSPGGIRPFRLAETRLVHPDTIAVRARFETAEVEIVVE